MTPRPIHNRRLATPLLAAGLIVVLFLGVLMAVPGGIGQVDHPGTVGQTPTATPMAIAPTAASTAPTPAIAGMTPTYVPPTTVQPAAPTAAVSLGVVSGTYAGPRAQNQVLRYNLGTEPPTLDPNKADDTASVAVLTQLYEGLTRFKPDLTVEPAIAQSWSFSTDGRTLTFKLRPAKWSDGTPITAKDFEYSWKRLIDPRTASLYAFVLTDDVVGADAFNSAQVPTDTAKLPQLESAVGVKAIDDSTFQVSLNGPASYFLSVAALWCTAPVNRAAVEKGGDKWTEPPNHVSNGPFKLTTWQHNSKIVVEANPNYWGDTPKLQRVEYSMITDVKAAKEAYKNNEIDIDRDLPQADIPAIRADPVLSKDVSTGSSLGTYYIGFNVTKAPFTGDKGKLVRQAISQAVDRQTLIDVVQKGIGSPAMSFVPPGLFGHQPNIGLKFDPAAAKATLQKAGYTDGSQLGKIVLMYNTSSANKSIIEFIAGQLKKNLNVDTDVLSMDWGSYLDLCSKDAPQMFRMGWNAYYPHPNVFLNVVFNSKSAQNYSKFNNAQFDQLVTSAAREVDQTKQLQLYNQAQQILVDEAPVLFVYHYGRFRLVKPYVKDLINTSQDPLAGDYFLRLTSIAQH